MSIKFYEGPSTIDGGQIMGYISGERDPSKNTKTGPALQVGVMVKDVHPSTAAKSGADHSVCGGCPLRPSVHKAEKAVGREVGDDPCYVTLFFKGAQWRSLSKAEVRRPIAEAYVADANFVRFGDYGHMSAVPRDVIEPMLKSAKKWTMYTHEWRKPENQWLRHYAMASVHSEAERLEAKALGWRTFRILSEGEEPVSGEIACPFETHGVQCIKCGLCNGAFHLSERTETFSVIPEWGGEPFVPSSLKDITIYSH